MPLTAGSLTSQAITMPGSMKAPVIQNTSFHGRRSARISDSEPGNQAGNAVGVHMHGVAEAEFVVAQDFAAEGIDSDVLRCREQREPASPASQDGPDVGL